MAAGQRIGGLGDGFAPAQGITHPGGQIVYASAGAEPLLILPAPDSPIPDVLHYGERSGLILGIEAGRSYVETTLALPSGGMLLMATDGITEARRGGEMLGLDGLKEMAAEAMRLGSVGAISRAVLEGARAFAGGRLTDDACLLLAQRR